MIQISKLTLIASAKQFFNTDKIAFVDVVLIDYAPQYLKTKLMLLFDAFEYNSNLYLPVILKGSPENLFLNARQGVESAICDSFSYTYCFYRKLNEAIQAKKVYDFTRHDTPHNIEVAKEYAFLTERYMMPYVDEHSTRLHESSPCTTNF